MIYNFAGTATIKRPPPPPQKKKKKNNQEESWPSSSMNNFSEDFFVSGKTNSIKYRITKTEKMRVIFQIWPKSQPLKGIA